MKKHHFLTGIAMLLLLQLHGNNPGKATPIVPLPKIALPYLEDGLPKEGKLAEVATLLKEFENLENLEDKELGGQRFYFPELEQELGLSNSTMTTVALVEDDDMNDVINAGEADADAAKKESDYKKIIDEGSLGGTYLDSWDDLQNMVLPAYRFQKMGNIEAIIVINSLTIDPVAGGKLGIYIGIKIPQKNYDKNLNKKNVTLIFGTENLGFSPENGISVGDIALANDVAFEIGKKKETFVVLKKGTGSGTDNLNGTYIKFGCNGIEEFGIEGEVHFSRKIVVPLKPDGTVMPAGNPIKRVVASTGQIRVQNWNDILVEGMGFNYPLALTKFPDLGLTLQDANLDMSDTRNPATLVLPKYDEEPVDPDAPPEPELPVNLWRGVFIKKIEVLLPNPFKKNCGGVGDIDTHYRFPDAEDLKEGGDELLAVDIPMEDITKTYAWDSENIHNNRGPNPPNIEVPSTIKKVTSQFNISDTEVCKISFGAENLVIDKEGVSGKFSVSNPAPIHSGPLIHKKWSWSLDEVAIIIKASDVIGFTLDGGIVVPITKKNTPFAYHAGLEEAYDDNNQPIGKRFFFTVKNEKKLEFSIWKAFDVDLHANTTLDVRARPNGDDFEATAVLYGTMSVGKGISSSTKIPHLKFEGLTLSTDDGVALDGGIYLVGGETKWMNFPIQISQIGLRTNANNPNKWGINAVVSLNFMSQDDGGLTAGGEFTIWGKRQTNVVGAHEWVFDKVQSTGIAIKLDFPSFKGQGSIKPFDGHDTYGDGFSGSISASLLVKPDESAPPGEQISGAINIEMMGIFGNKDGLRYFLIDGFASSDDISIPLAPTPFSINGFGGGVFYHMKPTAYKDPDDSDGLIADIGVSTSGLVYEPDASTLFGIKFATSLILTQPDSDGTSPFQGKLTCIVRFGSGMSLQNITFWGVGEYLFKGLDSGGGIDLLEEVKGISKSEDEMHDMDTAEAEVVTETPQGDPPPESKIKGKMGLSLDFDGGFSLHGYSSVKMCIAEGKITGHGVADLLIDPTNSKFHLYIGGYRDNSIVVPNFLDPENQVEVLTPVSVFVDFEEELGLTAKAELYFLLGNGIPGPPPVHPEAARYFDIDENSNNLEKLTCGGNDPASGSGVAFGANLIFQMKQKVKINAGLFKITILEIDVKGGVGFDIALLKYGIATSCMDGSSPHGMKGFRATGNIWAYVYASGKAFGLPISPGIGAGVYLGADIPNPSYFKAVAVIDLGRRFRFNLDLGEECGFPCSVIND